MNIIFQIDGGIGKSVAATAVCRAIKAQYPKDKLIVITGYPEVFLCNPYVDKVFNFNNLNYFYEDNVKGHEIKTMLHNPYQETDFITLNGHLIKVWCEMFGIKYNGEQPELFINNREQVFFSNQIGNSQKPILLLQTNGGAANQPNKYSWTRDLSTVTAQKIVYAFAQDYNIVHIRREDQIALPGTTPVQAEFRHLAVLISMSAKRLFIDSFAQHTAAALGLPSVVCWIGNSPSQFGYEMHTNILAHAPTMKPELRFSVFGKYNISGNAAEFPYNNEDEIFDVDEIISALKGESPSLKATATEGTPSLKATATEGVESIGESGKQSESTEGVKSIGESGKQSGRAEEVKSIGESGKQSERAEGSVGESGKQSGRAEGSVGESGKQSGRAEGSVGESGKQSGSAEGKEEVKGKKERKEKMEVVE